MSDEPLICSAGGIPYNKPALDELRATVHIKSGEITALRAEVAALKAQNERVRLVNKEGAAQVAQLQTELTQLRALRDRLVAIPRGPNQAIWFDDILALIKTAEALAKESP